jgi:hypothetical protein
MRIDHQIRHYSINRERKVLLSECHAAGALLAVPRGKFVTNLRDSNTPDPHLDNLVSKSILANGYSIHTSSLSPS